MGVNKYELLNGIDHCLVNNNQSPNKNYRYHLLNISSSKTNNIVKKNIKNENEGNFINNNNTIIINNFNISSRIEDKNSVGIVFLVNNQSNNRNSTNIQIE